MFAWKMWSKINVHLLVSQLQEAFARGDLKPGLNIEVTNRKAATNNIVSILQTLVASQTD